MVRFKDILYFDTETTGVPASGLNWETDFEDFPRLVQLAWVFRGSRKSHIIYPDDWVIPEGAQGVHGISTERAVLAGEVFDDVIGEFIADCKEAKMICGHNIYFDTSVVKAQILYTLGRGWYDREGVEDALFKGKRIDTMRSSKKWVDARTQDGRQKFPSLSELYSRCFPGESFEAHDALEDACACERCLPVLVALGLVKLQVRTYPDEEKPGDIFKAGGEKAGNGHISVIKQKDMEFIGRGLYASKSAANEKISEHLLKVLT